MQKGHHLQFDCITCKNPVKFSIFEVKNPSESIICTHCSKNYALDDPDLRRQLHKFEALCRQIQDSQEILGNTSLGIDIGDHQVKIPYKLLLTRLNSSIELFIGDTPFTINFRLEPSIDMPDQGF